jgi:hypothetical protein
MSRSGYSCPKCGCIDVYRSRRRSMLDRLISLFGFYPYSCEENTCLKRFYRFSRRNVQPTNPWKN